MKPANFSVSKGFLRITVPGGAISITPVVSFFLVVAMGAFWAVPLRAAAPFGHIVISKEMAKDIQSGKITNVPDELRDVLKNNPEAIKYFCGGSVAPDICETESHYNDTASLASKIMESARQDLVKAEGSGNRKAIQKAQGELAFAYGWLAHCAQDIVTHPAVNAYTGDSFRFQNLIDQAKHGAQEAQFDAYIIANVKKRDENYLQEIAIPYRFLSQNVGVSEEELQKTFTSTLNKKALGAMVLQAGLSPKDAAELKRRWEGIYKESVQESSKYIGDSKMPANWELDSGKITTKEFEDLRNAAIKANGGKLAKGWGKKYPELFDKLKGLKGQDREDALKQLVAGPPPAPPVPACFNDIPGKLAAAKTALDSAEAAYAKLVGACGKITPVADAFKNGDSVIKSAASLAGELNGVDGVIQGIKNVAANDPQAVFIKIKPLVQKAGEAQLGAAKLAAAIARSAKPDDKAVAALQQYAAEAEQAATEAETVAQPVLSSAQTIRNQLTAMKSTAQTLEQAKKIADLVPAQIAPAETALTDARGALAVISGAKETIEDLSESINTAETIIRIALAPALVDHPELPELAQTIEDAHAWAQKCKEYLARVNFLNTDASRKVTAADAGLQVAKAARVGMPDVNALMRQWLAIYQAARDYLAGCATVEAWVARARQLADAAKKFAKQGENNIPAPDGGTGGDKTVEVPYVCRLSVQGANALVTAKKLVPKFKLFGAAPPDAEAVEVESQGPSAGAMVSPGTTVFMTLRAMPAPQPKVMVPNVVGLSATQAYGQLAAAGLLAESEFLSEPAPQGKRNMVKQQTPPPSLPGQPSILRRGGVVRLQICGQAVVPSLIGQWQGRAESILGPVGLRAYGTEHGEPAPRPDLVDTIFVQYPPAGDPLPKDKRVHIKIYGEYDPTKSAPNPPPTTGFLTVYVTDALSKGPVPNAVVAFGGAKATGGTVTFQNVPLGVACTLTVSAPGYNPATYTYTVRSRGEPVGVSLVRAQAPPPPQPQPPRVGSLTVCVTDAATRAPVPNAVVVLGSAKGVGSNVTFPTVPLGVAYTLTVSAPGYRPTTCAYTVRSRGEMVGIPLVRAQGPPQPQPGGTPDAYAVYILTNISGGSIWVGRGSELRTMHTYDFSGGGLKQGDGSKQLVQYVKKSPDFRTFQEAKQFYLKSLQSQPRSMPLTGGTKAKIFGGDYWVDTVP